MCRNMPKKERNRESEAQRKIKNETEKRDREKQ